MRTLIIPGCFLTLCYTALTIIFHQGNYFQWFIPLYLLSFFLYSIAYYLNKKNSFSNKQLLAGIVGFALLFRLILLASPTVLSDDIYRYLWDGIVFKAEINPYQYAPNAENEALKELAQHYPYHSEINHPHISTIYPPLMQFLFYLVVTISPTIIMMKLFFILFDMGVIFLLYLLLKAKKLPLEILLLYAWNPLPIIEFAGNGHNDIVAIFFFVLALYFLEQKKSFLGTVAIAGSFLGKILGILILPFIEHRKKPIAFLLFGFLVLLFTLPFLDRELSLFRGLIYYGSDLRFNDGLFAFVFSWIEPLFELYTHAIMSTKFIFALLMGGLLLLCWLLKMSPLKGSYFLLGGILLFSTQLHPWYIAWILPLACLNRGMPWFLLSALVALSYLNIFQYHQTGIWSEDSVIKMWEYLPFYLALIGQFLRSCWQQKKISKHAFAFCLGFFFFLSFILLAGYMLFQGRINLDEGYFLTAAKRLSEGKYLYRDFAFTQGPVLPHVYSFFLSITDYSFFSGRFLTYFFASLATSIALLAAYFGGGIYALFITGLLLTFNVDHAYFSTIIKTYSLGSLFLISGVFLFLRFPKNQRATFLVFPLTLLAALTRVSLFPFFIFFLTWYGFQARKTQQYKRIGVSTILSFLLTGYLFYPLSFSSIWQHLVAFHLGFEVTQPFLTRAQLLKQTYQANFYSLWYMLALFLPLRFLWIRQKVFLPHEIGLLCVTLFVALFHFCIKTAQAEYQTLIYPVLTLLVGIFAGRLLAQKNVRISAFLLIFCSYYSLQGMENGFHTCYGIRDETWTPVNMVRYVGEEIKRIQKENNLGATVLTNDPLPLFIGGEFSFKTLPGTEMGPFSLYFDMESKEAEYYKVLNKKKIEEWIKTQKPDMILYTNDFFSLNCPSLKKTPTSWQENLLVEIEKQYQKVRTIGSYGQFHHTLKIYIRKTEAK